MSTMSLTATALAATLVLLGLPPRVAGAAASDSASSVPASRVSDTQTSVAGMEPLPGNPNLLVSGVPEIPAALKERLNQYLNARSAVLQDVAPDGRAVLVSTRFANTSQLHLVEHPLGARTQLTFFDEPVAGARFETRDGQAATTHGQPILFLQDVGGGEAYQIHRLDRQTGRATLLTDGQSRHGALLLSRDGRRAAFSSTARNGRDTDVYLIDLADPAAAAADGWTTAARRVTEEEGSWWPVGFSPDGARLLVAQYRAIDDADLWLVDAASGRRTRLTPAEGKGSVSSAAFSADGRAVYLVTDRWSDFNELYRVELSADGLAPAADPATTPSASLSRSVRWNVEDLAVAPDGSTVVFVANEDGLSRLYRLDTKSGALEPVDLPEPGVAGKLRFPRDRSDVVFLSADTSRSPSDVLSYDLKERVFTRWTRSEGGGLDPSEFILPELVRYPSTQGVTVPAFFYRPKPDGTGRKFPVLIIWHGGPEGQSRPHFSPLTQFLVRELGIAVLLPNVRGSDGYGKAFLALDDGVKREESLKDIGATLDWVAAQPDLDPERVAVYGGSYGGYMVLATAAFYPERIRAAVDVVGISYLPSFLQNTQAYRRDLRRREYGDERDPVVRQVQERISPLNFVEKIQADLFVQQGKNDPRVPQSEAEQIVEAVRRRHNGDPGAAWYLLALDEGHGFAKKVNRDHALQATVLFLQEKLLK